MKTTDESTRRHSESELHEICVEGHLDHRWADWVEGLTFTHEVDGTTTLTGSLADQAALHGVLNRMRDLGVPIVSVRRSPPFELKSIAVQAGSTTATQKGQQPMASATPPRSNLPASGPVDPDPRWSTEAAGSRMRAIVQRSYGSADKLELQTVDRPTIGANEVLVEVHAAGVDRGTWHLMTGTPYLIRILGFGLTRPKQPIQGVDVAGRVVAIGAAVTRFSLGDEVFGIASGSFAEYAAAHEDKLALKPANATFEQAAVAAVSGITALQALTDVGKLQAGQRVLIIGASGGVGTYAVQLAKALGADVTGVASTAKLDLVRSLGVDHVVDYTRDDFLDGDRRYDLILDIGGRRSISRLRNALTPTGALVIVGGEDGDRWTGGIGRQLRAIVLSPFVKQRLATFISKEHYSFNERIGEFIESGDVVPSIGQRFALEDTAEAIRQMEAGTARGKSVIVVRNEVANHDS